MKKLILALFLYSVGWSSETNPTKDEVTKLYVATFNRAPDSNGLNYWIYNSNLTLSQIAQSFFDQKETQELYPPSVSIREFVEAVYKNLFNREPDKAGWDYWVDELTNHRFTKNVFILTVINGALNEDKVILNNKTEVGKEFANLGLDDIFLAKKVIQEINATKESVEKAKNEIKEAIELYQIPLDPQEQKLSYPGKYPGMWVNLNAFAAIKNDGSVVTWGSDLDGGDSSAVKEKLKSGVKSIYSNLNAFAALKDDGSVVTWGNIDNSSVSNKLESGVKAIYSTYDCFAVIKNDGSAFSWGNNGNSDSVADQLKNGVKAIYSTSEAFAALKDDGSVVTWGVYYSGGYSDNVKDQLKNGVKAIYSTSGAFAALKDDGSVVTWGVPSSGGEKVIYNLENDTSISISNKLKGGVKTIYSTTNAFAALKYDGSVVTWGAGIYGGDSSNVADKLSSGVKTIYSNQNAFAALKYDGSVVTWSNINYGGKQVIVEADTYKVIKDVSEKLQSGIKSIYSTNGSFAALKDDGSVVTWGIKGNGGSMSILDNSSGKYYDVSYKLASGVKTIYSNQNAFAALKDDGSVVTWGNGWSGGKMVQFNPKADISESEIDISNELTNGVKNISSNSHAFSALKDDGSIISWGEQIAGGTMKVVEYSSGDIIDDVSDDLNNNVIYISKPF